MEKLNIPIKRWRKKYMILYQTEINNFCINDFFHEYNRKLHYRLTKQMNELLGHHVYYFGLKLTQTFLEWNKKSAGRNFSKYPTYPSLPRSRF